MKIPDNYKCSTCDLHGVKLWRPSHVMLQNVTLHCLECSLIQEKKNLSFDWNVFTDCIGNLLPAVPTEDQSYWGYSSVPERAVEWWTSLPIKKFRYNHWYVHVKHVISRHEYHIKRICVRDSFDPLHEWKREELEQNAIQKMINIESAKNMYLPEVFRVPEGTYEIIKIEAGDCYIDGER